MISIAKANIWNHFVGAVFWDQKKRVSTFEFDSAFLKNDLDLSPVIMPL